MSDDLHPSLEGFRPRLSVDITQTQADKLRELIPHGLRTPLIHIFVDDIIKFLENATPEQRNKFFSIILFKLASLRKFLPSLEIDDVNP